jgi:hypothetical protein
MTTLFIAGHDHLLFPATFAGRALGSSDKFNEVLTPLADLFTALPALTAGLD